MTDIERIIADAAERQGLRPEDVTRKCRRQEYVRARAEIAYNLFMTTDLRLREIAVVLGVKDHSSVCYLRNLYQLRHVA